MFIFAGAARLALEFLAQLVEQLREAGVGGGHHPTVGVVHGWLNGSDDGITSKEGGCYTNELCNEGVGISDSSRRGIAA